MNLSSIIVLLETILALLGNPKMAANPQVQVLANQAVSMASQALANPTTAVQTSTITIETPTSTSQPIVVNVQPVNTYVAPVQTTPVQTQATSSPVLKSAPAPSCTLSFGNDNGNVLSWNVKNPQQPLNPKLVYIEHTGEWHGGWVPYNGTPQNIQLPLELLSSTTVINYPQSSIDPMNTAWQWMGKNKPSSQAIQNGWTTEFELTMGGATCNTSIIP